MSGIAGLCVVGGISKMVKDFQHWHRNQQRPRERWEVGMTRED